MPDNTTWESIKTNLADGLRQVFPIIGKERDLHLEDIDIKDNKDAGDYASQKQAILNKTNWTVPVYGNLVLKDKEGKALEKSKTRLLSIPKLTNRNTLIYNGNEYSIANQIRLKPGVYTNTGDDGVTRSQFNVGKGANFSLWQEPTKGIFYIQFNQASIPLYPILKEIGVSDEDLASRWGKEVLDSNKNISDVKYKNAVIKVYNKLTYNKDEEKETPYDTARSELKNVLSAATLDPLVTKATLKKEYSSVTPDAIMDASRKILRINRGEEQPDDRESLIYKSVHGADDFIRESITKGARPVLWKVKNRLNSMYGKQDGAIIKNVFAPGTLSSPIYTNINISPLTSVAQDANPLKFIEASNRVTAFGPGGIGSTFAVPEAVRNVHPSHIGFIDTVRTQESDKAGIDLQLAIGTKKTGNTLTIKLLDRDGKKVRQTLQELQGKTLALPGQQNNGKIEAVRDGKLVTVSPSDVDYTIYGPNRMFSDSTVLVPFLSNNAGARANLGGKMGAQALPLKYREKPLVQTAANKEGLTNEAIIGRKISAQSPVDGRITRVTDSEIEIADSSGKKHSVSLYDNYIVGNKTYLNHEPVVKEGDSVKAGQLLADSNYSKDGILAMGTNLRTIYVPYKGLSVSGDTMVLWVGEDGIGHFTSIREVPPVKGIRANALKTEDLVVKLHDIHSFIGHYADEEMVEVLTMDGTAVKATKSHSFISIDDDGVLHEIAPGDMIAGKTLLPVARPQLPLRDSVQTITLKTWTKNGREISLPVSEDVGFLFGMYVSEGSVLGGKKPKGICIAVTEEELLTKVVQILDSLSIPSAYYKRVREDGAVSGALHFHSASLTRFIVENCGRGAAKKRIPQILWSSNPAFVNGFISGYWSGDGTVGKLVAATTVSKELAEGICFLLASIGVRATYRTYKSLGIGFRRRPKAPMKDQHLISVFSHSLSMFPDIFLSRKNEALLELKAKFRSCGRDRVPVPAKDKKAVVAALGKRAISNNGYMSRGLLLEALEKGVDVSPRLIQLIHSHVWWDVVKSVKEIAFEDYVYDLDMRPIGNFMVGHGLIVHNTHEDAIVVSDSAAQKFTSQHMSRFDLPVDDTTVLNKNKWLAYFDNKVTPAQTDKLDASGIVKPGMEVGSGDYLIAAMRENVINPEDAMLGKLSKKLVKPYRDVSVLWEKATAGRVVDVVVNPKSVTITVRTDAPLVIGDKITNREGGKGVVASILPDAEMPKDKDGNPYEVILNPATVMSRMNIGQLLETAVSKTATPDKPYVAPLFPIGKEGNISKEVKKILDKHGVKETDEVYDASGKRVGDIFAGKQYFYKLGKTTDTNYSARAFQGKYDADMMPVRGGEEGAKGIGLLDIYALLSHNARNILRESVTSKAEYNPEYFKAIQMGMPLPPPKPTFAFEKFVNYLKGAGVNVEKTGDRLKLLPFIDKDVLRLSSGKIDNAKMLRTKDLSEEQGGLFDFNKTGGKTGNKWSHIELSEPVLNPLFAEPARRLLGLREKDLINLQNNSGGKVVKEMLSKIDVNKRLEDLTGAVGNLSGVKKDDAVKQIKYLKVLKESNITPAEAYTIQHLPVIPPIFRPIYPTGDNGNMRVGDINNLYKQVLLVSGGLGDKTLDAMPEEEKKSLRRELFGSVKALQGLDKPVSGKDLKGFIAAIKGDVPKGGFFQSKLLKKQQDIAGRATIGGDPSLGLDEIKMPEDMAWTLYGPFVIGELVKSGMKIIDAETELNNRTDKAKSVLLMIMKDRPVLLNRAPTLHKFNIMAFKPSMHQGKTLLIPPMVMKPYGADVDGDSMQVHVPVGDMARREALNKMLPSQNLFSILDKSPHYAPSNEAVFGLYLGTKERKGSSLKTYQNTEDVLKDINSNRIQVTDPILLQNIRTTAGNVKVNTVLPPEFRDYNRIITKKTLSEILKQVGQKYPSDYARIAKELKDLGDTWAFSPEASLSFKDFEVPEVRDRILSDAGRILAGRKMKKDVDVIDVYTSAQDKLIPALMEEGKQKENKFYEWAVSGSRGNPVQFSSIWGAPVLVTDLQDRVIPSPIKRNFIEGLPPGEYFTSLYGTRKGITATKTEVQLPGALAKELTASNVDLIVTMLDCGTRKGIDLDISDRDALDRLAAVDIQGSSGDILIRRNTIITSRVIDSLRKGGVQTIKVRSVTTCEAPKGVCASCAGVQEDGKLPGIGENIGVKHSMSLAEPLTQMALSTKHTAGIGSKGTGISAIKTILEMPASVYTKEILAQQDGVVSEVKKLPTGGHIVTITANPKSIEDYLIPPGHRLLKTTGSISQGEPLTDGTPNIQDYVAIKGIEAGRNKLTETIRDFYHSGGRRIDRRVPETVARGILNYAKVVSPGDFDLVEGDVVEYNQAAPMQTRKVVSLPPSQTVGYRLADSHGRFSKDTRIDRDIAKSLIRSSKFKKIGVYKEPAKLEPVAFGINKIPVMKKDWLSRLGFRYLSNTITEGAATGMESNIHSMNPIPALAYGAEFGQGKEFDVY